MNSDYYKSLQSHLTDIRKSTGLKYLYTMRKTNDNKYIYVVDSTSKDDENFSALGDEEDSVTSVLSKSFNGNSGFEFHSDQWGNLISAYIPIKDDSDNIVGVLAADFDANMMVNQLNKFKTNICILVIIIIVVEIIIGQILSILLVSSLNKLKKKAELIKNGDLTVKFDKMGNDEIGELAQSFSEMVNNISIITNEIKNNTREVNTINNTIETTSIIIEELGNKSKEIDAFSKTISEITSQTNLLSLNAAIEAARAGEHGKVFAIVANEIKDLAEQSSNASSQISEIANSMQSEITSAIKTIEKGVEHANEGVASVNKVDSYLANLQKSSIDTNIKIKEIINSIYIIEQTCNDSLNRIHELDDISRSFSAGTQQAAASTEEQAAIMHQVKMNMKNIKDMTDSLNNVVNKFKVE